MLKISLQVKLSIREADVKTRREVLQSLLQLDRPLSEIKSRLASHRWDSETEIERLARSHCEAILNRFLNRELSEENVEEWANLVEGREDIGFEEGHEDTLRGLLHELANPLLEGFLTREKILWWLSELGQ